MRNAEALAEFGDGPRLRGAFGTQAVVDGRGFDAAPPRRRAQSAAISSRAVESGPPETASSKARAFASGARIASTASGVSPARVNNDPSAFRARRLLHGRRGGGIALADLGEGRAGLFGIAEQGERLAEPHHALRRSRRLGVVGGELEILLGRLARARALQIGLAEIEDRVGRELVRAVRREERLQLLLGVGVLARLVGVDRRVELAARPVGEVEPAVDHRRPGRVRRLQRPGGVGGDGPRRAQIQRGAGDGSLRESGRRQRRARRSRAERARGALRVGIGVRVESVALAGLDGRRRRRLLRRDRRRARPGTLAAIAETEFHVVAEPLQLVLEPVVFVLQFLDRAVGAPQVRFQAIDAQHERRPDRCPGRRQFARNRRRRQQVLRDLHGRALSLPPGA